MSRSYITRDGDMIDKIAFDVFQDETMVEAILIENPGLVDQPEILPYGLEICLPDAVIPANQNTIEDVWR